MSGKTRCVNRLSLDGGTLAGLPIDAHMKYLPCPSPPLIEGWLRCPGTFLTPRVSGCLPTAYGSVLAPLSHVTRHGIDPLLALWYWHHNFCQAPHEREGGGGQWKRSKESTANQLGD